jgi:hypothetical protein
VFGTDLVPDTLIGPRVGRPVAVEVARADDDGIGVGAIGESAAEAWVDTDVDEDAARVKHPRGLTENFGICGMSVCAMTVMTAGNVDDAKGNRFASARATRSLSLA